MNDINGLAILAATLAAWFAGAIYYIILGKSWMAALGRTPDDMRRSGFMAVFPFINSFICELVMALVLAEVLGPMGLGHVSVRAGLATALLLWIGFILTTMATGYAYAGRSLRLFFIDTVHWLIVMLLIGLVLGAMGPA